MSNDVKNCPAEEFIKLCFADDSGKIKNEDGYKFWENFAQKISVDVWEKDCPPIYNFAHSYDALPDPDVNSDNLYEAHERTWNAQCKKFNISQISHYKCELKIKEKNIRLGSDSIMSIYWHRTSGKIKDVIKEVSQKIKDREEYSDLYEEVIKEYADKKEERRFNEIQKLNNEWQKFIWLYLQKANTIGGFVVFPRYKNSTINTRRGNYNGVINDRFDLTLECIRRAYQYNDFYRKDNNPLFGISEEEKEFFRMFGSFENYIRFFCLDAWVNEDFTAVYDLMNDNKEETIPTEDWISTDNILPQTAKQWWTFYRNIMNRLNARNQQIKELIKENHSA